jgi:hypothetical protein
MNEHVTTLGELLRDPEALDEGAWVFLPEGDWSLWSLDTTAAVLRSEEVPPELENEPDVGRPEFAKERGLRHAVPVATLQDIVIKAKEQKRNVSADELLSAFLFYWKRDAFIEFGH